MEILNRNISDLYIYIIGIQGSGAASLAILLHTLKARVTGSDGTEIYPTAEDLIAHQIQFYSGFSSNHKSEEIDLLIYSTAYATNNHCEILAAQNLGIACYSYPEFIGIISRVLPLLGISGTHGKTSTSAFAARIAQALGLPVVSLYGSTHTDDVEAGIQTDFSYKNYSVYPSPFCIVEACEYQEHFLQYSYFALLITNVELDHTDYYKHTDQVIDAFCKAADRVCMNGTVILCGDDPGARKVYAWILRHRPDISCILYGFDATYTYSLGDLTLKKGKTSWTLNGYEMNIPIPGKHMALNASGAIALLCEIFIFSGNENNTDQIAFLQVVARLLENYTGCKGRADIIGEAKDILVLDDYGHHPSEISITLEGLRAFYAGRRLITVFLSHTIERTSFFFKEFAQALSISDIVIVQPICIPVREIADPDRDLARTLAAEISGAFYFEDEKDCLSFLLTELKADDLVITMGAGPNRVLGVKLLALLRE